MPKPTQIFHIHSLNNDSSNHSGNQSKVKGLILDSFFILTQMTSGHQIFIIPFPVCQSCLLLSSPFWPRLFAFSLNSVITHILYYSFSNTNGIILFLLKILNFLQQCFSSFRFWMTSGPINQFRLLKSTTLERIR